MGGLKGGKVVGVANIGVEGAEFVILQRSLLLHHSFLKPSEEMKGVPISASLRLWFRIRVRLPLRSSNYSWICTDILWKPCV